MIEIKNVNKVFHQKKEEIYALKDINLTIPQGEIYGIIGLSGAGKSTLVRCINRLEEISSGQILLDQVDIGSLTPKELREKRKEIGMIFQHFQLLSSRTVAQNIAFPLEIAGENKKSIENRVDELLKLVGLEEKRNAYPSHLSGGQKQRVAIARALACNPKVLLSDEATSALDPQTTQSILELLKEINQRLGVTIVVITHEMEVIKQICTQVAVMEGGQVIEEGDVVTLFSKPQHQTTKQFVNQMKHSTIEVEGIHHHSYSARVHLSFVGEAARKPFISQMIKKYEVDANILMGSVDHLSQNIVGNLVIEISGDAQIVEEAIEYVRTQGIECEVL